MKSDIIYHLTAKGEPAECRARKRACPLKTPHGSLSELESAIAKEMTAAPRLTSNEPWPTNLLPEELDFWKEVDKHLGAVRRNGIFIVLGDPNYSPYFCFDCYARLPKSELYAQTTWKISCPKCGHVTQDGLAGVSLKVEEEPLLQKNEVLRREWYHYTANDSWESQLNGEEEVVIHLGSQTAAIEREKELRLQAGQTGRVFKVRLKESTAVVERMKDEDPEELNSFKAQEDIEGPAVMRYVNHYEDPGSISLLADSKTVEIIGVRSLTEARASIF